MPLEIETYGTGINVHMPSKPFFNRKGSYEFNENDFSYLAKAGETHLTDFLFLSNTFRLDQAQRPFEEKRLRTMLENGIRTIAKILERVYLIF